MKHKIRPMTGKEAVDQNISASCHRVIQLERLQYDTMTLSIQRASLDVRKFFSQRAVKVWYLLP